MEPIIELSNVSKVYDLGDRRPRSLKERVLSLGRRRQPGGKLAALSDISLTLAPGETLGLIGFNGSGKSTLLKVIAGITEPTTGTVRSRGRVASLLELGVGFHPEMTGRENIFINGSFIGLSERDIRAHLDEIVEFSELERFIDTPVKHYSSGMFLRLGFAVGICLDPDVLLIDEGFAVGDETFQIKCIRRIRELIEEGKSLILVSHSLSLVVKLCSRAILLHEGCIAVQGSPSDVMFRYHRMVEEKTTGKVVRHAHSTDPFTLDRIGSRDLEIVGARLLNADGVEYYDYLPGDDWTLEIELHARRPLDSPKLIVGITDFERRPMFVTKPDADDRVLGRVEGPFTCRFHVHGLNLMPGYYLVSVLTAPYHHDVDALDGGASWLDDVYDARNALVGFHVCPGADDTPFNWGVAFQPHSWEFDPPDVCDPGREQE